MSYRERKNLKIVAGLIISIIGITGFGLADKIILTIFFWVVGAITYYGVGQLFMPLIKRGWGKTLYAISYPIVLVILALLGVSLYNMAVAIINFLELIIAWVKVNLIWIGIGLGALFVIYVSIGIMLAIQENKKNTQFQLQIHKEMQERTKNTQSLKGLDSSKLNDEINGNQQSENILNTEKLKEAEKTLVENTEKKESEVIILNQKYYDLDYKCPSCGSNLQIRKGPYGKFFYCTNYCGFTMKATKYYDMNGL